MSGPPLVEARGLAFSYPNIDVLHDVSFTVEAGASVAFLGPSGCGKTTLLHLVAGIRGGHGGSLEVRTRRISYVFQHDTLLGWRSVIGNVLLPFELAGTPVTDELRARGSRILADLGLGGCEALAPAELSGGMKKRVELARALASEPELLILDEPFSSLDLITRERLNVLLRDIHTRTATTMILVTHSVEEACFLAQRVHVLAGQPASIINLRELGRPQAAAPEQFLLSPVEAAAATEIRRSAKILWTSAREAAEGAGSADGRRSATPAAAEPAAGRLAAYARRHAAGLLVPLELLLVALAISFLKPRIPIPDFVLPRPLGVASRFVATLASGAILGDLGVTVFESLAGFLIAFAATLVAGYGIAKSPLVSRLLMPWLVASNTIPSVALAPFLVLWFGFGLAPRVVTAVVVVFFPMLVNIIAAIGLAERATGELAAFFRPRPARRFAYFELPASLPVIASGVTVSITLSVIGAVVGEFVSGSRGLGALVSIAKANFDTELMFVGLVWLVILGLGYYAAARGLHRLVARRLR